MYHAQHEPKKLREILDSIPTGEARANALGLETEPFPDVDDGIRKSD